MGLCATESVVIGTGLIHDFSSSSSSLPPLKNTAQQTKGGILDRSEGDRVLADTEAANRSRFRALGRSQADSRSQSINTISLPSSQNGQPRRLLTPEPPQYVTVMAVEDHSKFGDRTVHVDLIPVPQS
ncbi:hypothetical protein FMUND_13617 [Fusarium mundagurra]|uniref:Uncharacterized protein n=1 Tax=Fusarium mundagurra TaxID=1567541 RepID=A0A8H5XZE3_9HYPO|nr:hypothetical protein FMUND_13617 [Fusarium mundagurra]